MHAVVVVALLLLLFAGGPAVVARVVNGKRVGPKTTVGADGLVTESPHALARAAGLDVHTYALARALSSEHGSDPDPYLRAVAWAIRNKAIERRVTVLELLTEGRGTAGDGWFGEQKASAGVKYASTRADPSERHARIAAEVLAAMQSSDPTFGATHFFSPRAADALAAKAGSDPRFAKYAGNTAAAVDAKWRAPGGLYPSGAGSVVPAGVDPQRLTLYRRLA